MDLRFKISFHVPYTKIDFFWFWISSSFAHQHVSLASVVKMSLRVSFLKHRTSFYFITFLHHLMSPRIFLVRWDLLFHLIIFSAYDFIYFIYCKWTEASSIYIRKKLRSACNAAISRVGKDLIHCIHLIYQLILFFISFHLLEGILSVKFYVSQVQPRNSKLVFAIVHETCAKWLNTGFGWYLC